MVSPQSTTGYDDDAGEGEGDEDMDEDQESGDAEDQKLYCYCQKTSYGEVSTCPIAASRAFCFFPNYGWDRPQPVMYTLYMVAISVSRDGRPAHGAVQALALTLD